MGGLTESQRRLLAVGALGGVGVLAVGAWLARRSRRGKMETADDERDTTPSTTVLVGCPLSLSRSPTPLRPPAEEGPPTPVVSPTYLLLQLCQPRRHLKSKSSRHPALTGVPPPPPDVSKVRELVALGACVTARREGAMWPVLHQLIKDRHVNCVAACLEEPRTGGEAPNRRRGIDFTVVDEINEATPLHYIAYSTSTDAARRMLSLLAARWGAEPGAVPLQSFFARKREDLFSESGDDVKANDMHAGGDFSAVFSPVSSPNRERSPAFNEEQKKLEETLLRGRRGGSQHGEGRPEAADRVNWLQEDCRGHNIFSVAARMQRLSVLWNALRAVLDGPAASRSNGGGGTAELRRIPLRCSVWEADWAEVPEEDRERFDRRDHTLVVCSKATAALARLSERGAAADLLEVEDDPGEAVAALVRGGEAPDLFFRGPDMDRPILHRFIHGGKVNCLRACLGLQAEHTTANNNIGDWGEPKILEPLDLRVTNNVAKTTVFHAVCDPVLPEGTAVRLLEALVDRLQASRGSNVGPDAVNWRQPDRLGKDFMQLAAEGHRVVAFWPVLRRLPYFSDVAVRQDVEEKESAAVAAAAAEKAASAVLPAMMTSRERKKQRRLELLAELREGSSSVSRPSTSRAQSVSHCSEVDGAEAAQHPAPLCVLSRSEWKKLPEDARPHFEVKASHQ